MNYRALTWPCGDRPALLTKKISLIFQSGRREESLLLLTLLPRSVVFPKDFILYLEGNQTWTELENSFLWNQTHQICQIMFSEVNLGGQHQRKSSVIAYTGAHRRASRYQGRFAWGKPNAQILPPATTGLCCRRVIAEVKCEGHV